MIRRSDTEKTGIAVSIVVIMRNTAVARGTQLAFAIVVAAGTTGPFPVDEGFTRAFLMGAAFSVALLCVSALMPGRPRAARPDWRSH